MFKIVWDKETGGVKLSSLATAETLGVSPRPVFYEELNLLGLKDLGWKYPECQEPLLWACNKQYFYKGDFVFEAKGANIYDNATIHFQPGFEKLTLKPVDVKKMLERTKEPMFLCESEAIEFIRDVYETYSRAAKMPDADMDFMAMAEKQAKLQKKQMAVVKEDCDSFEIMPLDKAEESGKKILHATKIDVFLASFSGGKDSQVVLDLCTRALPPSAFQVIYSDTGYELPSSLELYQQVQDYYHALYPELKFSLAKNHESVLNYWDKIGTPSDKHRWCCAVMKTAPLYRTLKLPGTNKQAKVLAFEGVRAEESNKRSGYDRIGKGVKHSFVTNARPILRWNTTEIFLYLMRYKLPINEAYRVGKPRVGCVFCPFSSPWDDMIVNRRYNDNLKPFLNKVVEWANKRHIPNLDEYIKERKWKLRASGNDMKAKVSVSFKQSFPNFIATIKGAEHDIETWLYTLCDYTITREEHKAHGELRYNKLVYPFEIEYKNEKDYTFTIFDVSDIVLIKLIKRVIFKSVYCISCEVCEVECPTGALSVHPSVTIDKKSCIHCRKCLEFHDNGCIVASSLTSNMENKNISGSISKYGTFGIHEEWIDEFFANPDGFWDFNALGNKQVDSFKAWLKDAEFLDSKNHLTELGKLCAEKYNDARDQIWEIIWINLTYNSSLANWFINMIQFERTFDSRLLSEFALDKFSGDFSTSTIKYAINGFCQLFTYSPIGNYLRQGEDYDGKYMKRSQFEDISDIGFAYALYKYAEANECKSFRVSDFYSEDCMNGPYKEFGIERSLFEKLLRTWNSASNRLLVAELNMGLDHITLRDDLTSLDILQQEL